MNFRIKHNGMIEVTEPGQPPRLVYFNDLWIEGLLSPHHEIHDFTMKVNNLYSAYWRFTRNNHEQPLGFYQWLGTQTEGN